MGHQVKPPAQLHLGSAAAACVLTIILATLVLCFGVQPTEERQLMMGSRVTPLLANKELHPQDDVVVFTKSHLAADMATTTTSSNDDNYDDFGPTQSPSVVTILMISGPFPHDTVPAVVMFEQLNSVCYTE
ncbi:hypothetical protein DM860_013249 [Cuscuta australis]|uniref:Uncharacterized protein n=1 Tax=Cuscuta australis TaxID=267555 RepID=A0A328DNU9_9ASTE|nr:hypothetical protein DM860_013249 [Cuscuta australis]